ncbi:MAG: hypothetical protein IH937_06705 [Acidobacteria bacterium]|nr:hypothetical protein [Acidobacteriota bacterium]
MKYLPLLLLIFQPALLLSQQRPLITERAETVKKNYLLFDIGLEFLQDTVFTFSGLEGDLTRIGVVGVRFGAADNVEIQVLGTIQDILSIESRFDAPNTPNLNFSGNSTSDFGDFTMATKVLLKKEQNRWPAISTRFGFQMPNASNQNGLGNDETNFFSSFLLQKQFGSLQFFTELGLAVLGDPVSPGAQDDLFTYGLALIHPLNDQINVVVDAYGRVGAGGIGTEEQSLLRLGTQVKAAGLYWDVALVLGFRDTDPSSGLVVGVSKEFRLSMFGN